MGDWADEWAVGLMEPITSGTNGAVLAHLIRVRTAIATALRQARADALEEAAKVAEADRARNGHQTLSSQRNATAIRSLKDKP